MLTFFLVDLNVEVHAVVAFISEAIGDEFLNENDNFLDIFSDSGDHIWEFNSKLSHVIEKALLVNFGEFLKFDLLVVGVFYDFVVDVGDVHA